MKVLDTPEAWNKILNLVHDDEISKQLNQEWSSKKLSGKEKWDQLVSFIHQKKVKKF